MLKTNLPPVVSARTKSMEANQVGRRRGITFYIIEAYKILKFILLRK